MDVSHIFAANDPILYEDFNDNFDELATALSQVDGSMIAANAGIASSQISDRYTESDEVWNLLPFSLAGTIVAADATGYIVPQTPVRVAKHIEVVQSGKESYLSEVQVYVEAITAGGTGGLPRFQITKNGTVLGGGPVDISAGAAWYRIRLSSDPVADPFSALQDGDILEMQIGKSNADSEVRIRGVSVKVTKKREFVR